MPRSPALVLALLLAVPPPAIGAPQGDVHRCTGADGQTVFSDRKCEDLGTVSHMPPAMPRNGETGLYRYGCPRRLSELVGLLRASIEAHDVNRLSSLYLWGELSDPAANSVLTQLEAISSRSLVDIAPVYPEQDEAPVVAPPPPPEPLASRVADDADDSAATAAALAGAGAGAGERPRPWGLRLEQVLANGSTPARTVLRLRRQYNCFWITL